MNMTTLQNLKETIKELNAPSVIDGETYESSFNFIIQEKNNRFYLFDENESYHIDYLEEQNALMYDCSLEFGFKFEAETIDKIHEKLEQAIKKDLGQDAYLEWENNVRMLIVCDYEEEPKTIKISGKTKEIKLIEKPKTLKQEMIEAIEDDTFYGFIANNYHRFTKDELATIIKEFEFARYTTKYGYGDFREELIKNLEENFEE